MVDLDVYSFLTTTPNPLVETINHELMPVLLTREEEFETWLTGSPDDAFSLAREYASDAMQIVQEGLDKEDLLGKPPQSGANATLDRARRRPQVGPLHLGASGSV